VNSSQANQGQPANRDAVRLGVIQQRQEQQQQVQAAMQRNRQQAVNSVAHEETEDDTKSE